MFKDLQAKVKKQFDVLTATGALYYVDVDKETIWQKYLDAFSEADRASNVCNCCRQFIRMYAGVVALNKNQEVMTLWDFEAKDDEYDASIKVLREYVKSLPIAGIFYSPVACVGTEKNVDRVRNLIWNHYHLTIPRKFVNADAGPLVGSANDDKNVLERSLNQITDEAVEITLELIASKSLYRGNEHEATLKSFKSIKNEYKQFKGNKKNFCWAKSLTVNKAVCRIRNSAIGTLLNDLSEGRELDSALTAFEKVVAPSNYKRPTAIATPAMIEKAKSRLQELGLIGALQRRQLSTTDLNVSNSLYVYRPIDNATEVDLFDVIKKDTVVNPKSLSKMEEIGIEDFVNKVLPTCKSVKLLLENRHLSNFVSLVGPSNDDKNTLFKWNNNFSWSYLAETADSLKERVKSAGGNVDGVLRVSLSWYNHDDLDIHIKEPGSYEIYFGNKGKLSPTGGMLDVDMNAGAGTTRTPVENIFWKNLPTKEGRYKVIVNNYQYRESNDSGFEVEFEFDGDVYNFHERSNGRSGKVYNVFEFDYSKKDGVTIIGNTGNSSKYVSKKKWGIASGQFHEVNAITLSPNYWNGAVGNKHFMFFLKDCKADSKIRGFYNEFLKPELNEDRKVFEMLSSKAVVEPVENELSGIGFSDTQKNHVILEVQGQFKRTLKVII